MTVVCELLRFGAAQGWVAMPTVQALAEPRFLLHPPAGLDVGEGDQNRWIRARTIKFAVPDGGFQFLSDDQLETLMSVEKRPRDQFLVALLTMTGMRIGEALGLHREDVHLLARAQEFGCQVRGPHVHVRRRVNTNGALAKSRFPRTIPVTVELAGLYADYQHQRYQTGTDASDMVFVNQFRPPLGRPMTYSNAKDLFDRLSRQLGFPLRPHMLRHTAANSWRRQGVPRDVLQELLGHVSSSSMDRYFHPTDGEKRQAVERVAALRGAGQ
jgi:integrase